MGGTALNIVPDHAEFLFEIRNLAQDNPADIMSRLEKYRDDYLRDLRTRFGAADITIDITNTYPSLSTDPASAVVGLVQSLAQTNRTIKVAFGTEGGLFSQKLDVPTVVCGPGSMDQGHKPDEYVEICQLAACDAMMDALLDRLVAGV
ncbi:Acetylornithine deacetylase [Ascidiaceihabitans donghaensis]|uniref:Acetylornithine deacetylase n=1 Tax=Ascidiaceihabitans donghaensis TaxID=1510460 RepID=A0A2R8BP96_9RHOB|nr:Acetylornithine deacetylase [Ascidiaceihabitans donghaensis]